MSNNELVREAVMKASRLRSNYKISPDEGLCPYDLALELGLKVVLTNIPTLEGMYSPEPTLAVIIGSERPAGRRRYTCAHEIGHHVFGHGAKIDELDDSNSSASSPDELVAQAFAGALLMPVLGIRSAFNKRNWKIEKAIPEQFFIISQEFGVGYTALITHLEIYFPTFTRLMADSLRKHTLKSIRSRLAGFDINYDLFVVDKKWNRRTIDVETGDIIILPDDVVIDESGVERLEGRISYFRATEPGIYKIKLSSTKDLLLRISRREFSGLGRYRHLQEEKDE